MNSAWGRIFPASRCRGLVRRPWLLAKGFCGGGGLQRAPARVWYEYLFQSTMESDIDCFLRMATFSRSDFAAPGGARAKRCHVYLRKSGRVELKGVFCVCDNLLLFIPVFCTRVTFLIAFVSGA